MTEFDGQVAVVTGGARGIGAAIARRLARGGASVVCADVLDTDEIVAEISQNGGSAEGVVLDVTDPQAAAEGIKGIHEKHGRLDILVNNAGVTRDQLLVRMKPEDWDFVLGINLDGVFHVSQPAAKIMMRAKTGRGLRTSGSALSRTRSAELGQTGTRNARTSAAAASRQAPPFRCCLESRHPRRHLVSAMRLSTPLNDRDQPVLEGKSHAGCRNGTDHRS